MEGLEKSIKEKGSCLCIGLDIESRLIGYHDPLEWCLDIILKTHQWCILYKINLAFFELCGIDPKVVINYCHKLGVKVIIDGKRGDIGNTSEVYKKVIYDKWFADGATLNPYMGYDSLKPFLDIEDKFSIILGLTSNESEFQRLKLEDGLELWEKIIIESSKWERNSDLWYVMGANKLKEINHLRSKGIDNYFLVPGVGHQGGDLERVLEVSGGKVIINMSRSLIYSSDIETSVKDQVSKMKGYV